MQATDLDSDNGSVVWFSIETQDAPFVVDRDTGVVTTAGIFKGQSGITLEVQVRAFDNFGIAPTLSTLSILSVSYISMYSMLRNYDKIMQLQITSQYPLLIKCQL